MFITTLNIPFIGVTERLLLFSLSGLACDVFHRHALPYVYHYALRQGRYLRHIQNTDKVITGLRMVGKKCDKQNWLNRLNRRLRKMHIPLGIALAVTAFVHAIFSSTGIFAPIWGALCLIFLVLTCLTWLFRKKKGFSFMKWHRALTVVFLITLVLHLAELPALKAENSSESRGGESYSQTQLNE